LTVGMRGEIIVFLEGGEGRELPGGNRKSEMGESALTAKKRSSRRGRKKRAWFYQ